MERFYVSAVWFCFDIKNLDLLLLSCYHCHYLFISDLINEEPVGSCIKAGVPHPLSWQAVHALSSRHDGRLSANIWWGLIKGCWDLLYFPAGAQAAI